MDHYFMPVAVAIGGAAGSLLRYLLSMMLARLWGTAFPYGTAAVNGIGSFCIGFLAVALVRDSDHPVAAALLITGFLGGFTTFSSFMNETMQYMMAGAWEMAAVYLSVQLAGGILFVFLGGFLARSLF